MTLPKRMIDAIRNMDMEHDYQINDFCNFNSKVVEPVEVGAIELECKPTCPFGATTHQIRHMCRMYRKDFEITGKLFGDKKEVNRQLRDYKNMLDNLDFVNKL